MRKSISFQEDVYESRKAPEKNTLSTWLIRKDIVKNQHQANILLIVLSILCIGIALYALPDSPKEVSITGEATSDYGE